MVQKGSGTELLSWGGGEVCMHGGHLGGGTRAHAPSYSHGGEGEVCMVTT